MLGVVLELLVLVLLEDARTAGEPADRTKCDNKRGAAKHDRDWVLLDRLTAKDDEGDGEKRTKQRACKGALRAVRAGHLPRLANIAGHDADPVGRETRALELARGLAGGGAAGEDADDRDAFGESAGVNDVVGVVDACHALFARMERAGAA